MTTHSLAVPRSAPTVRRLHVAFLPLLAALAQLNLLALFEPAVAEGLQYDRAAIASGQVWRLVTGHFVHWSFEHAAWDLFAAAILLVLLRNWSARGQLVFLVGAALAISSALWWTPDLATYRGLSGIDAAWFAAVLIERWRSAAGWREAWLPAIAGLLFAAKLVFEVNAGRAVFVSGAEIVVPEAHLVGAAWACLVALGAQTVDRTRRLRECRVGSTS